MAASGVEFGFELGHRAGFIAGEHKVGDPAVEQVFQKPAAFGFVGDAGRDALTEPAED